MPIPTVRVRILESNPVHYPTPPQLRGRCGAVAAADLAAAVDSDLFFVKVDDGQLYLAFKCELEVLP